MNDSDENDRGGDARKKERRIDEYRLIEQIGEGFSGRIWRADLGGVQVALKILNASVNSEEVQRAVMSLERLKKLHHKFLLHTENFWFDGGLLYVEMELADGGNLKERLKACKAIGKVGVQ